MPPAPVWRLIVDEASHDGAWNMALDRALQLAHARGDSPPTLRLYGWVRPTVTLGRFQRVEGVDLRACRAEGIDVARRYTGGRGVLHDDEVTYSVIAGVRDGVPKGTTASYRYLCGALVEAYELLGVPAGLTSRPRGERASAACYLHATHADVSLGALKLSGSAQVWHHDSVLQHGSFVISRDVAREGRVFGLTRDESEALSATTITIADACGQSLLRKDIEAAVTNGFERALGVRFERGSSTSDERRLADGLLGDTGVLVGQPSRPTPGELQAGVDLEV